MAKCKEYLLSVLCPKRTSQSSTSPRGCGGRSRTDFVREPAVRAAKEALMENALIRLSPEGFKAFIAALAGPGQPVAETVGLARRLAPRETSGKGR